MGYRNLTDCVNDLEQSGNLIRVDEEIDANLEAAEIHRRVYQSGGPAILFDNVKGCEFPMVSNLFGTLERAKYIFRDAFENVQRAIQLKVDPGEALRQPLKYWRAPFVALQMRPKAVRTGPVMKCQTSLSSLPQLKSWPDDGGAFVTLPQVYSEDVRSPGLMKSNLGMYRVQISGNQFAADREVGMHYQIHRGIGVQHKAAMDAGKPFHVNIFVGGNPAMTVAAVMPLPEGMSELTFAGALAGHRIQMVKQTNAAAIYAQADFCISGTIDPQRQLPEGPFGDHLGYYSLTHDFPVLNVKSVYHRKGAIWPFTVVGRPPQEDTVFGELIHELTGPVIPTVLPGIKAVNAVDASGVHPLLLAIGSERYVPYRPTDRPQELLTQANAVLGQGQMSLAKFLWIIDEACDPKLDIDDIETFFLRMLERVDWKRDLHFQTKTTIDTLDYSGSGLNQGSKVVIAAVGPRVRELPKEIPSSLSLPDGFRNPQVCIPGVLAISAPKSSSDDRDDMICRSFCDAFSADSPISRFPLVLLVDDSEFTARSLNNFLWTVFTRSNPAVDIDGIDASIQDKHWGCGGSLVIDARVKSHHAPPLIENPKISKRVDAMAARGGPLAKYL
ncbi:MAG: UbiD family decarboxylase [Planctomycetaceae bacterium]|nr:UbiD family decarboxylase [Planctomycetaceae bacterium]